MGIEGEVAGRRWRLREGDGWLGSAADSLVTLPADGPVRVAHLRVSRQAIVLTPQPEAEITVNDRAIAGPTSLRPGDRVALGGQILGLEVSAGEARTVAEDDSVGVALPPPDPSKWRMLLLLVALILSIAAVAAVIRFVPERIVDPVEKIDPKVREAVRAATVWIRVPAQGGESEGSGFVSKQGYILTNAHVVDPGTKIRVTYDAGTDQVRSVNARLIRKGHAGEADDIALLAAPTGQIKPLPLVDVRALSEGVPVAAFGFPLGSAVSTSSRGPQISIRAGRITALRKDDLGRMQWIESDIAAEVGNSGGPVVTHDGKVLGLATMLVGPNLRTARIVSANLLKQFAPGAVK